MQSAEAPVSEGTDTEAVSEVGPPVSINLESSGSGDSSIGGTSAATEELHSP